LENITETIKSFFASFTVFDIVALVIILLLAIRCLIRGFVKEILSLAGIIGGVILGRLYADQAAEFFMPWVDKESVALVAGFAAICIGCVIVASLASWLISRVIRKSFLGWIDRLAGFIVGALQGLLITGVFVLVIYGIYGSLDKSFLKDSVLAGPMLDMMHFLSGLVVPAIKAVPQVIPGTGTLL